MQKENGEKGTQEESQPQGALPLRERPVGARLRLDRRNLKAAGAVLLLSAVVLLVDPSLLWEENEREEQLFCFWFVGAYSALTLGNMLLCLLEIRLPDLARQIAGWVLVLLMPLGTFFAVDLINETRVLDFTCKRGFANYLCYLMVFALIYALCRRVWITALAGGAIFLFFGIVNYFVIQFRGQPILPWDILSVSTAMTVSGGYEYIFTRSMVLSISALLCAVLLCFRVAPAGKGETSKRSRIAERLCALAVSGVLAVLIFPADLLTDMGISVWAWNQKTSSELTGVMAGFFANIQFVMVDKPEGYSAEKVEKLGAEIGSMEEPAPLGEPDGLPTIIVVMNESMTDLQSVGDVEFEPDNLPFIHSLQQSGNVIWGTAYSSVYGGNTCNSEYEFLTGNTTAFLPAGSKPYQQYVDHEQTALPSILESYGYYRVAIHPGNPSAWQRDTAYPWLNFDEFVSARDFDVKREVVHNLTSDESHYDQIIYKYEHRDKTVPQFLFTVTIQNHGGYEDEDLETTVRVNGREGEWPQTEQYLSLTKLSDQALEDFIGYFENQEDPVVVLFFGDHWPNLETDFLSELLETDADNPDFETLMKEHQVPFLIWANYPLESQHIEAVSLNYLSGLLLRAAGMEGTAYTKYLEGLRQQLPVITAVGTMDREGNLYKNGEKTPYDQLLNEYAILQYNNAFGGEEKAEELFTKQPAA